MHPGIARPGLEGQSLRERLDKGPAAEGGFGALEVAFRFSRLDLMDRGIDGGALNDLTAAVNLYPTSNARVMFNLIRAKRVDTGLDPVWIAQIRLQWAY